MRPLMSAAACRPIRKEQLRSKLFRRDPSYGLIAFRAINLQGFHLIGLGNVIRNGDVDHVIL